MIDGALESVSVSYKLAMRILLFFLMSSVAQLVAEKQNCPKILKRERETEGDIFTQPSFKGNLS